MSQRLWATSVTFNPSIFLGPQMGFLRVVDRTPHSHSETLSPPLETCQGSGAVSQGPGVETNWVLLSLSQHRTPISWMGTMRPEEVGVHPPEPPPPPAVLLSSACIALFFSWVRVGLWAGRFVLGREPAYSPWEQHSPIS